MTNRYDEDAMIVTHGAHPDGFPGFVNGLSAALGGQVNYPRKAIAVVDLEDGKIIVSTDGGTYSAQWSTRFDVYEDDDAATEAATNQLHNAFVDRIHSAVSDALPGVQVDLVDENDRLIHAIEHEPQVP